MFHRIVLLTAALAPFAQTFPAHASEPEGSPRSAPRLRKIAYGREPEETFSMQNELYGPIGVFKERFGLRPLAR
jgi:hypothetical protein